MTAITQTMTAFAPPDHVVNGIDTDGVHALIESVEAEPANGHDPLAGRQRLARRRAFAGAG